MCSCSCECFILDILILKIYTSVRVQYNFVNMYYAHMNTRSHDLYYSNRIVFSQELYINVYIVRVDEV